MSVDDNQDAMAYKNQILKLQHELEITNQKLYDCTRQLRTATALEAEYQNEIELLQTSESEERKKLQTKIMQLEDDITSIKNSYNDRINNIEAELVEKNDANKKLKDELERQSKLSEMQDNKADSKLLDELIAVREENELLIETIQELKESLEGIQKSYSILQEKNRSTEVENERLIEALTLKKDELIETTDLIQTLQDEVLCLKAELESLRDKPLEEKSKGNSLFSEVDDRRVQLQSTVNTMKVKYLDFKRERASHLKLITHLQNENMMLCKRWEAEIVEKSDDEEMVLNSYKKRIQTLEELLGNYQKEFDEKIAQTSLSTCEDMRFFDNMLKNKKKENESLRQKIAALSLSETTLSYELADTRQEMRRWRLQATQLESEINKLKSDIEEMQLEKTETALKQKIDSCSGSSPAASHTQVYTSTAKETTKLPIKSSLKKTVSSSSETVRRPIRFTEMLTACASELAEDMPSNTSQVEVGDTTGGSGDFKCATEIVNKENESQEAKGEVRKVKFSAETTGIKSPASNIPIRPRAKVHILKPMHISNIPKAQ